MNTLISCCAIPLPLDKKSAHHGFPAGVPFSSSLGVSAQSRTIFRHAGNDFTLFRKKKKNIAVRRFCKK
jgi:hypothetical protein